MEYNEKAILKTLIYSNMFDYPLTKEELWRYAISPVTLNKKKFFNALHQSSYLQEKEGYYYLSQKKYLIKIRVDRGKIAEKKMASSLHISKIIGLIPFIYFIGITGSLAVANTKKDDDIDLCIITQNNTLWLTRFLILLILQVLGKRRQKYETNVNNKLCVNLMLEESQLGIFSQKQNIYTAHEITQIKPLFIRYNMFQKFLSANIWVKKFLPHAIPKFQKNIIFNKKPMQTASFVAFFNLLAKQLQLWYMKKHRTSEIISDSIVAFYPGETQKRILNNYEKALQAYEI